jgi:NhaP-type Na+/H+ or K+/H+ antiporter
MGETNHQKGLLRVMVIGTSISFGAMAAIVVSMKDFFRGNAALEFSYKTVVAFLLGCVAGWLFWKFVKRKSN